MTVHVTKELRCDHCGGRFEEGFPMVSLIGAEGRHHFNVYTRPPHVAGANEHGAQAWPCVASYTRLDFHLECVGNFWLQFAADQRQMWGLKE